MNHYPPSSSRRQDFELHGKQVVLTSARPSDSPDNYRWECDAELAALNGRAPLGISYLDYIAAPAAADSSSRMLFAIRTISDDRHIGNCALYDLDRYESEASLGINIGERRFRRRGFGTDAIRTLVNFAFLEMGIGRLQLKTLSDNRAALACFAKCGFRPRGTLYENGRHFMLMQLLPNDRIPGEWPTNYKVAGEYPA